jgi:hypothetical protein
MGQPSRITTKIQEFEITKEYPDIFSTLKIQLRNQGQREITKLRAMINDVALPYTFNVSVDNPILSSRGVDLHRYTAWYIPGGDDEGYIPEEGEWYKVTLTIEYSNGFVETITRHNQFKESHGVSIGSLCGFEKLYYDTADLLAAENRSSLNIYFRNDWYYEGSQTVDRLELVVDGIKIWDESVRIKMGNYFAVTVATSTLFETEQYHNVTLVAHSTEGNTSTFTRRVLCQEK